MSRRHQPSARHRCRSLDLHRRDIAVAGQWQLIWWEFKRHKLGDGSLVVIVVHLSRRGFARFLRAVRSRRHESALHLCAAAAAPLSTRCRTVSFRPHVDQLQDEARPESHAPRLHARSDEAGLGLPSSCRRSSPISCSASFRCRPGSSASRTRSRATAMYCSAPTASAATSSRRIIHGAADLAVDRSRRRLPQPDPRRHLGGISGYLRRLDRFRRSSASSSSLRSIPTIPLWLALGGRDAAGLAAAPDYFMIT